MADTKRDLTQITSTLSAFYQQPVAKVSLELFLSFGLVIVLALTAIKPTLTTIAQLNKEVEEKKEMTDKLSSKISALTSAINLYNQHRDRIQLLNQSLPPTASVIDTLKIIEKIAGESNVVITGMTVARVPDEVDELPTNTTAELSSLPITVRIMGQYQDMRTFVEMLHGSRRTIQVLSANFTLEETRGQRALTATLTIDAPYYGIAQ